MIATSNTQDISPAQKFKRENQGKEKLKTHLESEKTSKSAWAKWYDFNWIRLWSKLYP